MQKKYMLILAEGDVNQINADNLKVEGIDVIDSYAITLNQVNYLAKNIQEIHELVDQEYQERIGLGN